jgi:hypothetical protein
MFVSCFDAATQFAASSKLPGDRQKRVPWAKGLRGFFPLADSLKSIKVSEFRAPRVMSKNMGPMPAVSIPKVD